MVASWQGNHDKDINNKPAVAINEIIDRICGGDKENIAREDNVPLEDPEGETGVTPGSNPPKKM